MLKTLGVGTTFGSCDVEKVHAVVARSTFPSQNVQNTSVSDHFWKLRCRNSDSLSGIYSDILFGILSGIYSDIFPGILSGILSDRRKFRSQTSDNMDRWKAGKGRGREKKKIGRKKSTRERVRRKKMQMREKVGKSRNTVFFPMIWGSGGSKSRLAKAAGAEPAGQMRDEKLHAVVGRSTFRSQNVKNTRGSDHFWRFTCRLASLRFTTLHYITLHYTTLHHTTLHNTTTTTTQLHSTTLNYTTHYTTLHYTTLHYSTLPSTTLHYITLHSTTLQLRLRNYAPLH